MKNLSEIRKDALRKMLNDVEYYLVNATMQGKDYCTFLIADFDNEIQDALRNADYVFQYSIIEEQKFDGTLLKYAEIKIKLK